LDACITDFLIKSAVRDQIEDKNVASDFYDALNDEVATVFDNAARRAEENDRKIVQPRDL
jgi:histone H3/H4